MTQESKLHEEKLPHAVMVTAKRLTSCNRKPRIICHVLKQTCFTLYFKHGYTSHK